jgi:repressor LexA
MFSHSSLTKKESFVLDYIRTYQHEFGTYPTYREIMQSIRANSVNSVCQYLKQLEEKGEIEIIKNKGYRLTHRDDVQPGIFAIPLLGAVQAGVPNSTQEAEETINMPEAFIAKPDHTFILRVRGESMKDAGFNEGDHVIVERREARVGEVVVALLNGENTVKRLVEKNGQLFLKAENPEFTDIYPKNEWSVQGVVVGLWRRYS